MFTQEQKDEICKILRKKSRYVWKEKNCNNTIALLERVKNGDLKLVDIIPGMNITFEDYLFERDVLKFVT